MALDTPFSQSEVVEAIKAFPLGKTADPSGSGSEFYMAFHKALCQLCSE